MLRKILVALLVVAGSAVWLYLSVSGKAQKPPDKQP